MVNHDLPEFMKGVFVEEKVDPVGFEPTTL